jgi:hypothetical protein
MFRSIIESTLEKHLSNAIYVDADFMKGLILNIIFVQDI